MNTANDNQYDWSVCEDCGVMLCPGHKVFRYADSVVVCEADAPSWDEAKRGFERDAFENPDNWYEFQQRMRVHLANGGTMTDKCVEAF